MAHLVHQSDRATAAFSCLLLEIYLNQREC